MKLIIGSARIDEKGKIKGGELGDNNGKEVSTQAYYLHGKGWNVLRPKTVALANGLASAMSDACANGHIGYDQSNRYGVIKMVRKYGYMKAIKEKTEADCSSLVRGCCIQNGFDPTDFTTLNEADKLEATGKFKKRQAVTSTTVLYNGDVLVTKTTGHTAIIVSGNPRKRGKAKYYVNAVQPKKEDRVKYYKKYFGNSGSIVNALLNVGEKDASFSHRKKIAYVNNIKPYSGKYAENMLMLSLLKQGKLKEGVGYK